MFLVFLALVAIQCGEMLARLSYPGELGDGEPFPRAASWARDPPPEGGPGPGTQGGKDGVERGGSGYTGEGARRSMIPGVTSNPSGSLVDSLVNCLFSWNYV